MLIGIRSLGHGGHFWVAGEGVACGHYQYLRKAVTRGNCLLGDLPIMAEGGEEVDGSRRAKDVPSLRKDYTASRSRLPGMRRSTYNLSSIVRDQRTIAE